MMNNKLIQINCSYLNHNNRECILLKSEYNVLLNKIFRTLDFIKYSNTYKSWYILKNKDLLKQVIEATKHIAIINISALKLTTHQKAQQTIQQLTVIRQKKISDYNTIQLNKFIQQLILKGYSNSTIKTYKNELSIFLQTIGKVNADTLTTERIKNYLYYCFNQLQLAESSVHSRMNALKFYYEQVLFKEKFFWEIPRPKKPIQLPKVISEEKIINSLFAVENLKHKTILLLAYSAGLRVSEVVSLKVSNIDSNRMQIIVEHAKGKKDRVVTLSKTILKLLREYYIVYKPKYWLFNGQEKGMPYGIRSAQIIFKDAIKKINLPARTSFHSLRHSYATHLLDNGTDIKYIQKLMGHNDIKTTLRYLHVTNKDIGKIESPLDKIMQRIDNIKTS